MDRKINIHTGKSTKQSPFSRTKQQAYFFCAVRIGHKVPRMGKEAIEREIERDGMRDGSQMKAKNTEPSDLFLLSIGLSICMRRDPCNLPNIQMHFWTLFVADIDIDTGTLSVYGHIQATTLDSIASMPFVFHIIIIVRSFPFWVLFCSCSCSLSSLLHRIRCMGFWCVCALAISFFFFYVQRVDSFAVTSITCVPLRFAQFILSLSVLKTRHLHANIWWMNGVRHRLRA